MSAPVRAFVLISIIGICMGILMPTEDERNGISAAERGDAAAATTLLRKVVMQGGGGTARTWNNLGVAFFLEGRQRDAASAFAEALKRDIAHETVFSSHAAAPPSLDATPLLSPRRQRTLVGVN